MKFERSVRAAGVCAGRSCGSLPAVGGTSAVGAIGVPEAPPSRTGPPSHIVSTEPSSSWLVSVSE